MPRYVIERDIPGVGGSSPPDLRGVARKSNAALRELGTDVQWVQSYVTGDRVYCVYIAATEELVREHARRAGVPATRVSRIVTGMDPTTEE
jgi:hypothetical protein